MQTAKTSYYEMMSQEVLHHQVFFSILINKCKFILSVFTDVHASFIAVIFYFWNSNANNNNNNLYCALDTKSVKTLKGNNCEKKEYPATQK